MELSSIEKLLEKYDNGETTIEEEQQLKAYFIQNEVAPHLKDYQIMFQYFNTTEQEDLYTKQIPLKVKESNRYKWMSVAAVLLLSLGFFTSQFNTDKLTYSELTLQEQKAYNQAVDVINLVGSKFGQGESNMAALALMSSKLSQGTETFEYFSEFSKTTNKIFASKNKIKNGTTTALKI
jgi:hypothetical protein